MPIVVAFLASLTVHFSVLLADGWSLPNLTAPEEMEVVLATPPAPPSLTTPITPSEPRKVERPATKSPRKAKVLAAAPVEQALPMPAPEPVSEPMPATSITPAAPSVTSPVAPMPASRLAQQGVIRYTITRGESGLLIGQAIHRWEHVEGRYTASAVTETIGIAALFVPAKVVQESSGRIDSAGLKPEYFRHEQRKRSDEAFIEREHARVRNSRAGDSEREWPLGERTDTVQDALSMYYQLCQQFFTRPFPEGEWHLPIVTGRKLDNYRLELLGEEELNYRLNRFATQHIRTRNGDDTIDLWIVPTFPLPLRIRFVDRKGDIYDQWMDISNEGLPK